jgi:translation initiation factor 2 alpha subunit (eIF-2alpha)
MRDFTQNIVKSPNLNEFNDEVSDAVEDLADTLQESPINNTTDLMTQLTEANDNISQFGDTYDTYMRDAKNGESVEKFIKSIKDSVKYYEDLNNNGGLAGTLRYGEISNEQIKELQDYMRHLNILSKELFNKYAEER